MTTVKAMVLTGYGLNCDYETDYALGLAGADSRRVHINELIAGKDKYGPVHLADVHMLVFGGGFSWADDHGAGVLMAIKMQNHLGRDLRDFVQKGGLILGICNGFQALVNLGLLPGFDGAYQERCVALACNDSGNFVDQWVHLKVHSPSRCVFTRGLENLELPVRHGEGKFYAPASTLERLLRQNQVVFQYADEKGLLANGARPWNPNGSLRDIAGICDPTGRIFGLMPHPEAFNHFTNHPEWTFKREALIRAGKEAHLGEGDGIRIFRNAVEFCRTSQIKSA